jgi:hypothetical protein
MLKQSRVRLADAKAKRDKSISETDTADAKAKPCPQDKTISWHQHKRIKKELESSRQRSQR